MGCREKMQEMTVKLATVSFKFPPEAPAFSLEVQDLAAAPLPFSVTRRS